MPIVGLRDTSNFVANQRPETWREAMLMLYPNSSEMAKAPLTAISSLMKDEVTQDPVFHWWEKKLDERRIKFAEDLDATETALDVDTTWKTGASAKICKIGDLLYVEASGEILRVTADPTADNLLTVARAQAGTSGTIVLTQTGAGVNPYAFIIGSAFEEGSAAPSGVNYDPIERSNYTQIFRSTLEMTRTAQKTRLRTPDAVKEAKREALEYIGIDMERAFFFGRKSATTLNGRPIRYTGGLVYWLETFAPNNIVSAPLGIIDMDWLELMMRRAFKFGSTEKMAFCGDLALSAINQAVRKNSQYNITFGEKEFGMSITRLRTPFGHLILKSHPLFTQADGGTAVAGGTFFSMNSWVVILDMDKLRYRYLTDSDLKYSTDLQLPGIDAMKAGFLAECGWEINHPDTHFIWKNVAEGVADA